MDLEAGFRVALHCFISELRARGSADLTRFEHVGVGQGPEVRGEGPRGYPGGEL